MTDAKKAALALVALVVAGVAVAGPNQRRWSLLQPSTGTAPDASTPCTAAGTQGLPMSSLANYYVCVTAASGLGGAGTLQAYFWDPFLADAGYGWAREPGADETVNATSTNAQCFPLRVTELGNSGCARWVPSSVTSTDGGSVNVSAVGTYR